MISVCRPPVELGYLRKISSIVLDLSAFMSSELPSEYLEFLTLTDIFLILADRTARGMIGSWHETIVRASVCPSDSL